MGVEAKCTKSQNVGQWSSLALLPGQIFLHKICWILPQNMNTGLQDMQIGQMYFAEPSASTNDQKTAATHILFYLPNLRYLLWTQANIYGWVYYIMYKLIYVKVYTRVFSRAHIHTSSKGLPKRTPITLPWQNFCGFCIEGVMIWSWRVVDNVLVQDTLISSLWMTL